jgi:rRNA processing protein Krr1/Pno1
MTEHLYATEENADFALLLSLGFSEEDAARLVYMKSHVTEQVEYREMVAEQHRLNFIRWLVEHDRLER